MIKKNPRKSRNQNRYQISSKGYTQITKFMGPTWDPPGSCRPQMGPMLAPLTLLSEYYCTKFEDDREQRNQKSHNCRPYEVELAHTLRQLMLSCSWLIDSLEPSLIARSMGPTWGPSGADRTQVCPMLAPWTLLSGMYENDISDTASLPTSRKNALFHGNFCF